MGIFYKKYRFLAIFCLWKRQGGLDPFGKVRAFGLLDGEGLWTIQSSVNFNFLNLEERLLWGIGIKKKIYPLRTLVSRIKSKLLTSCDMPVVIWPLARLAATKYAWAQTFLKDLPYFHLLFPRSTPPFPLLAVLIAFWFIF